MMALFFRSCTKKKTDFSRAKTHVLARKKYFDLLSPIVICYSQRLRRTLVKRVGYMTLKCLGAPYIVFALEPKTRVRTTSAEPWKLVNEIYSFEAIVNFGWTEFFLLTTNMR